MVSTTEQTISIVIPVYNGGDAFRQCLSSVAKATPGAHELIVVSDGDTDGSWRVAEEFGAKTLVLPNSGGPAKARNLGARAATGNIVFFVDADVEIYPQTIALVAEVFRENPEISALIGSYDDAPGALNFLSQYKNLFHHYTHQTGSEDASTFWGACGAIRRDVFLKLGGFDEKYRFPCVEDIELGYRLKRSGDSIRLCKHIQVKHLKRWEPISLLKAEIFYRALPWTELILRDRTLNADLNLSHTNRIGVVFVFALIGMLSMSWVLPWLLLPVFALAIALLAINIDVYRFFYQKRGLLFTLQVIPWHWFYFLYGGAAFAYGMLRYYLFGQWKLTEMTDSVDQ